MEVGGTTICVDAMVKAMGRRAEEMLGTTEPTLGTGEEMRGDMEGMVASWERRVTSVPTGPLSPLPSLPPASKSQTPHHHTSPLLTDTTSSHISPSSQTPHLHTSPPPHRHHIITHLPLLTDTTSSHISPSSSSKQCKVTTYLFISSPPPHVCPNLWLKPRLLSGGR